MSEIRLTIDDKVVTGQAGETILAVAARNGIDIPSICYGQHLEVYGSCGLCVVEVEGMPKLCKACATTISADMVVHTRSARVLESRKTNLELLLSNHTGDCRGPCQLNCPAGTDCQGYVGLIANGKFETALKLIKEKIPLPASIGRVCPHPCEDNCRRALVEEPISIACLKRVVADMDLANPEPYLPATAPDTGKKVVVVGGGPYGLSIAYFLRLKGHNVTILEAMPKAGGMLRYGIPEYRLPKAVLDKEIALIEKLGVEIRTGVRLGADISLEELRSQYDAVCLGLGAWRSTGMGAKGEDLPGVIGGINFLRKKVAGERLVVGKNVAIVGGGNTAMDACRTAVRLGAEKVYNIYRRTKDEMPAEAVEIEDAEAEGVIFKNLRNPIEFVAGEDGSVKKAVLQVMELGEPDASGRRSPVAVPGKTETIEVDQVILAIGQAVESVELQGMSRTRKGGIAYDKDTFMTSLGGVFAGGDCGNDKISIAVEAIADAEKSSGVIDAYLRGETVPYKKPFTVTRDDVTEKTFEDRERHCRQKAAERSAAERKGNFEEYVSALTPEQAVQEASRCLECGCHDYFECKLVRYANDYGVTEQRFHGAVHKVEYEDTHPHIVRDPNKCILCGLCVRICDEAMQIGAVGFTNRGFQTLILPALGYSLAESGCISCGQCLDACPTGALGERLHLRKQVPLKTETTSTTCSLCSTGCSVRLHTCDDMLIKVTPDLKGSATHGLLCGRGKFGFDCHISGDHLTLPLIRKGGKLQQVSYDEAFGFMLGKIDMLKDADFAMSISDRLTNEEAFAIKNLAEGCGATPMCFNMVNSVTGEMLGKAGSPNEIGDLYKTDFIMALGFAAGHSPMVRTLLRRAKNQGAHLVAVTTPRDQMQMPEATTETHIVNDDTSFLAGMVKALLDVGAGPNVPGRAELEASLKDVAATDEQRDVALRYAWAKKAMLVYQEDIITENAARLVLALSLLTGHIGGEGNGILMLTAKNNTQGLSTMGIGYARPNRADRKKAMLVFCEDPENEPLEKLDFLMVCDSHLTETAKKADIVFPANGSASVNGTYINTERRLMPVRKAVNETPAYTIVGLVQRLGEILGSKLSFTDEETLSKATFMALPGYEADMVGVIPAFGASSSDYKLLPVESDKLLRKLVNTDYLLRMANERILDAIHVSE